MIILIDKMDDELLNSFECWNCLKVCLVLKWGMIVEWSDREGLKIFVELMKIIGECDGFLMCDISYFENIYDVLYEDGDVELFLVKLDLKENIVKVN